MTADRVHRDNLTEYPFLVKVAHQRYVQAPRLWVGWRPRHKPTGRSFAGMREVVADGWDRGWLRVRATSIGVIADGPGYVRVLRASGESHQSGGPTVKATATDLKGAARRLRPQEAAELDRIDRDIHACEAALRELRGQRKLAVAQAWVHGNVVRLQDAEPDSSEGRWVAPRTAD